MKKKAVKKKSVKTVKKEVKRVSAPKMPVREKGLNFMVQINDPKALRKDLLEALREVIIFMQGYETFRKVQEEKVVTFSKLRDNIKELNNLIDNKLRKFLPKGKLKSIGEEMKVQEEVEEQEELPRQVSILRTEPKRENNELDDLEYQLKDIENRLKKIQ
ncbi:MAG: hypothetical protein ABH824_02475 [Nanoarchaeota archaeon]|nr:hypothetical protein [Nanoarchaeota archaeon]MBU1632446.1 hypothetical protein [Nanoarchaeota archaeon]MBU1876336.1 hypothetical protein [Nanoarchaeota archaeon]